MFRYLSGGWLSLCLVLLTVSSPRVGLSLRGVWLFPAEVLAPTTGPAASDRDGAVSSTSLCF